MSQLSFFLKEYIRSHRSKGEPPFESQLTSLSRAWDRGDFATAMQISEAMDQVSLRLLLFPPDTRKLLRRRKLGALLKCLGPRYPDEVRRDAAAALGELGDPQAIEALTRALEDREWSVRCAAVDSLAAIDDPRATAGLGHALGMKDPGYRDFLKDVMGRQITRSQFDEIHADLTRRYRDYQSPAKKAAKALARRRSPEAIKALVGGLPFITRGLPGFDGVDEQVIMDALAECGEAAIQPLVAQVNWTEWAPGRKLAAVATLALIPHPAAVEALLGALQHPDGLVREEAAKALKVISGQNYGTSVGEWSEWWESRKREGWSPSA